MAAAIETMFSVRETPWHKLGVVLQDHPQTAADAITAAGLDWDVRLEPLYWVLNGERRQVDRFAVIRTTDDAIVGDSVGSRWTPLQSKDAFKFFDPFIESGQASYETAGSLSEGRRIWVMAKLNRDPMVVAKNDEVLKFLLLSNSHDGSLAIRVGFTPIRVVCANTLAMAHQSTASKLMRIRHTKSLNESLDKIQEITNAANMEFEATAEQYRFLARRDVHSGDLAKYVKIVMDLEQEDGKLSLQGEKTLVDVVSRFEAGLGLEHLPADNRRSWWIAYNAVTEHLSYSRGRTEDTRLNSLWFGEGAKLSERALAVATEMASKA